MNINKWIFVVIMSLFCGNVFALSPYATTIQQNVQKKSFLTAAKFPTTAADVSFVTRTENKAEGYKPYFNRSAFSDLSVQEQDEMESMAYRAELQRLHVYNTQPFNVYCENYPEDDMCLGMRTSTPQQSEDVMISTPQPKETNTQNDTKKTGSSYAQNRYMTWALTAENVSQYNLKTHNGGCTPPERSNFWPNKILTTGKYQYSHPAFEKFMITVFRKEGSCVNDPNDRGGYTCYGCASNGLCKGVDFKTITRGVVEDIAYDRLYKKYNVEKLPDAFRGYLLWGMFGSGEMTGIKIFQKTLGVPVTYKLDDATIRAAENYKGDFGEAYTNRHEQYYRDTAMKDARQKRFLQGWLNAINLLRHSGCHVVPTSPLNR